MSDYQKGFNDGFAAAIRADSGGRSSPGAEGYDGAGHTKKISVGFDPITFDRINAIARDAGQSFGATVRNMVRFSIFGASLDAVKDCSGQSQDGRRRTECPCPQPVTRDLKAGAHSR